MDRNGYKLTKKTQKQTETYNKAIPCAPELSVFGTIGAHDHWSCAFRVFEMSDFGLFLPPPQSTEPIMLTNTLSMNPSHSNIFNYQLLKLDGVGPVDNRPSTDKLQHFVKKNKNKKYDT